MGIVGLSVLMSAFVFQILLAARVAARLVRTAGGAPVTAPRIFRCAASGPCVTVILPVLDEAGRIGPCLESLRMQASTVGAVLVVDGGSRDATKDIVRAAAVKDPRLRLLEAPETPFGWNNKAWNLQVGLQAADSGLRYVLMLDADVRVSPRLAEALVEHAKATQLVAFSVATNQRLADALSGLVHPAMLTTLVYRFGIPGSASSNPSSAQANGQCFFAERKLLVDGQIVAGARDSRCEDFTMARAIARSGNRVGFYETAHLAQVRMYDDWRALLRNWPRSLAALDHYGGLSGWIGLFEIALVQALPPWIALALVIGGWLPPILLTVEVALCAMRLGVLFGTRRAYIDPPITYWLSPLADVWAVVLILASAVRRRHTWRGRTLTIRAVR